MTQNTKQNGQTQLVQIGEYSADPHTVCFTRAGFEHQIAEAKDRGAAEQRRKDAEGQEPVAYTSQIDLDRVRKGKTGDIYSTQKWEGSDDAVFTIPLYTRPANVAELEERIAELETERDQYREGYLEMEALRKFYATDERHLKVVALAREALVSDGDPS